MADPRSAGTSSPADHGSRGAAPTAVRAPEMNPRAGATSVKGRARSTYARGALRGSEVLGFKSSRLNDRDGDRRGDRRVDEVQHVVVQDTRSFDRRRQGAFDQRAGGWGVAATTTGRIADPGTRPAATPIAASANAAVRPAAVPSGDIAPGVPGLTRLNDVTRNVDRPQALPISLATVSLPPAASDATSAISAAFRCGVGTAAIAAAAATPQFAIAFPAPRRPARSSAIPSTIWRLSPSLEVIEAARKAANNSSHAPAPPPR